MKNKRIFIILFSLIIFITLMLSSRVYAASASVRANSTTIKPGESTTITASVSATEAWNLKITASGGSLSGTTVSADAMGSEVSQSVMTATFTASSEGTYTISLTGQVTGSDLKKVPVSSSCTITVKAPAVAPDPKPSNNNTDNTTKPNTNTTTKPNTDNTTTTTKKSNNSNLSALQVAEGVISPEFSKTVKEYTVSVPYEVTKLSIAATPEHSKGTVKINGNDELKVGENIIEIIVTAEDSSTDKYTIKAVRAKQELALQTLNIYYVNENGEKVELQLDPQFSFDVYSYTVKDILTHTIQSLNVDAKANAENAKIEIVGNEELKSGTNEITIKVSLTDEAGVEEQKTYTITVQKEEEPVVVPLTTMQKIQNFFGGFGSGITKWISSNFDKILTGMLLISTSAFIGLTIYFAVDYKNYQKLLAKLASYNKENLMERASVALKPENSSIEEVQSIEEKEDKKAKLEAFIKNDEIEEKTKIKTARGKRFK